MVFLRVTKFGGNFGSGPFFHNSLWVNTIIDATGSYLKDMTNIRNDPTNQFFNNDFNSAFAWTPTDGQTTLTVTAMCDPSNQRTVAPTAPGTAPGLANMNVQLAQLPSLSVADVTVSEGAGAATVTITMDATVATDVTVDYATADGTATAPDDYASTSGTATVSAGALTVHIVLAIVDDDIQETNETFTVTLSNSTGGVVISPTAGSATVIIVDDETLIAIPSATAWGLSALAGLLAAGLLWSGRRLRTRRG